VSGVPEPPGEARRIPEREIGGAAATVARALAWHTSWAEWVLPDTATREPTLARLVAADIEQLFVPWGEAWALEDAAISLWIPPASAGAAERFRRRRTDREYAHFGRGEPAIRAFDDAMGELRPRFDHWYLDTLATEPERMGEGLGSRLLEHGLSRRDAEGIATALDTESAATVALYERHGFNVVGEAELPGGGPHAWMMVREPGG